MKRHVCGLNTERYAIRQASIDLIGRVSSLISSFQEGVGIENISHIWS